MRDLYGREQNSFLIFPLYCFPHWPKRRERGRPGPLVFSSNSGQIALQEWVSKCALSRATTVAAGRDHR